MLYFIEIIDIEFIEITTHYKLRYLLIVLDVLCDYIGDNLWIAQFNLNLDLNISYENKKLALSICQVDYIYAIRSKF